ncbi:metal-dependent hydrolase family protein [Pseudoruegeria sp. SHC-113]|uniref:metal-dependent hydrolase family protein n=1 Tax=Pseudoruegeria sp. SHC-113 TaxID=2855439 RepID=UPI0021BB0044|nr:amidohydrolase family protein [Pseudoruegeria sp. SHC-113]MCT8158623.1 amidohydrolase family protein [Pseudoruegeria sp. SHC-113]
MKKQLAFALSVSIASAASAQEERFPILFTNVHVFDGVNAERIENANVLVVENLIAEVSTEPLAAANARIINGGGRTLMPGLIDAHVHMAVTEPVADLRDNYDWMYWGAVSTIEAEKMLLRGFTTVRDAGGPAIGLQKAIDRGKAVGPRIYPSGPVISQTSGHGEHRVYNEPHPNFMGAQPSFFNQHVEFLADGVPEVLRATREALRMGATQIKVMAGGGVSSSVDPLHTVQGLPEELEASVKAAADWDTYVMVHAYNDDSILRSLEAGVISIEHGQLMTEVGAQAIKDADAWIVPFYSLLGLDEEVVKTALGPAAAPKFLAVQEGARNQMKLIKEFGIEKVAFSTDIIGDPVALTKQNDEFKYRLEVWTSHEILQQATSKSAELLALSGKLNPYPAGQLGVIEPGAYADLLLVEGNPVEDVELLVDYEANIDLIMKDGAIYKNTLD